MVNKKDRKICQSGHEDKEFSKNLHQWLAQYDEVDDFLCGKVPNFSPDFNEEE
jgi:hypothetical protein